MEIMFRAGWMVFSPSPRRKQLSHADLQDVLSLIEFD